MNSFTFYVITDTHYYDEKLGAYGKKYDERMRTEQKLFRENAEVDKALFRKLAEDNEIETIIIAGDLSQDGEYENHVQFIEELEKLKAAGKRILLITALHDYNDSPKAYIGDELVPIKGTKRTELREMYNDYGYSEAIAIDEVSYSYVAQLCEGVRLLAINVDGEDRRGHISDAMKDWIKVQMDEAAKAGDRVIAMEHYPLIPQQPIFGITRNSVLEDWEDRANFLADVGVHLIFTGHMHAQSVKRLTTENGNSIIDVQTSSTIGYPAKYRTCTITDNKIELKCFDVPDCTLPDGTVVDKEYFRRQFAQMIPNELGNYLKEGKPEQTGLQKFLLKKAKTLTFGQATRLLGIRANKEIRDMKITDFAVMLVFPMFEGDPDFRPGTPVYDDLKKIFKRLSPVIKKVNEKLSKNGKQIDITELIFSSLYRKDELCDNDCTFEI